MIAQRPLPISTWRRPGVVATRELQRRVVEALSDARAELGAALDREAALTIRLEQALADNEHLRAVLKAQRAQSKLPGWSGLTPPAGTTKSRPAG